MGNRMVTLLMTSSDPIKSNSWQQYTYSPISQKQLKMLFSKNC